MPIRVKTPHGIVQFPDGTSQADMAAALASLDAPSKEDIAAQGDEIVSPGSKEPDTWLGGFSKSLKNQVLGTGLDTPLIRAAHPGVVGDTSRMSMANDISTLLLPSEIGTAAGSVLPGFVSRSKNALKAAGAETKGVGGALSLPVRAIGKFKESLPSSMETDSAKFLNRGGPTTATPISISSGPDVIDRNLKAPAPTAPAGLRHVPSTGLDPNQYILDALQEAMGGGDKPALTTLPPEATTAGEGAMPKLMGARSKRPLVSVSSGRPSISATRQDEILGKLGGTASPDVPAGGGRVVPAAGTDVAPTSTSDVMGEPSSSSGVDPSFLEGGDSSTSKWHSGEEPGSAAAKNAQHLHALEAELEDLYRRALADPRK